MMVNRIDVQQRIQAAVISQLEYSDRLLWELENPRQTVGIHSPEHPRFIEGPGGWFEGHAHTIDRRQWRPTKPYTLQGYLETRAQRKPRAHRNTQEIT